MNFWSGHPPPVLRPRGVLKTLEPRRSHTKRKSVARHPPVTNCKTPTLPEKHAKDVSWIHSCHTCAIRSSLVIRNGAISPSESLHRTKPPNRRRSHCMRSEESTNRRRAFREHVSNVHIAMAHGLGLLCRLRTCVERCESTSRCDTYC